MAGDHTGQSHMTALLPLRISLPLPHQSAALDGLLYNSSLFDAKINLQRNTDNRKDADEKNADEQKRTTLTVQE